MPLAGEERLEFFEEILPLATPQVMSWKAQGYDSPSVWERR